MATADTMALRAYQYWILRYRRTWRGTVVISIANPLLFLVAIGLGLGRLVGPDSATLGGVDYLAFFAPGILAAAAMQNGIIEAAFPVAFNTGPGGAYPVAAATPLEPEDILHGHLLFMASRVVFSAAVFMAVMVAFGAAQSPLVLLALPAAALTAMAFALPSAAWAVTLHGHPTGERHLQVGRHAALPVLRHVLRGRSSCRRWCARSSTRLRCGTASTCAAR